GTSLRGLDAGIVGVRATGEEEIGVVDEAGRVVGLADLDAEVRVRPGGDAGMADVADDLSALDLDPDRDAGTEALEMAVDVAHAGPDGDVDAVARHRRPIGDGHGARFAGEDRGALWRGEVEAGVEVEVEAEPRLAADRVPPEA